MLDAAAFRHGKLKLMVQQVSTRQTATLALSCCHGIQWAAPAGCAADMACPADVWCTVQVNISELVNTVFCNVLTMQQEGVKLHAEVDPRMPIIIADKDRLTQVMHTDAWVVKQPL